MASQMDPDNIVAGGDGMYCLCFRNFNGKTKEEITEVFEKYGNVHSVRFAGTDTLGMTFVRYRELEEAKRCFEEMRNTKEFNVRVANSSTKPRDNNGSKFKQNDKNFQRKGDENSSAGYNDNGNHRQNFHSGKGNFQRKSTPFRDNENLDLDNRSKMYHKDSDTRSQKSNSSGKHNDNVSDGPPPLVHANDLPPLLDTSDIPALVDKKVKVKAVDIILANFPLKTRDEDIYNLVTECGINVVAISKIEATRIKFNIPYCHLWLNSLYDADTAETKLNGLSFGTRRLVAVKTHTLLTDN